MRTQTAHMIHLFAFCTIFWCVVVNSGGGCYRNCELSLCGCKCGTLITYSDAITSVVATISFDEDSKANFTSLQIVEMCLYILGLVATHQI